MKLINRLFFSVAVMLMAVSFAAAQFPTSVSVAADAVYPSDLQGALEYVATSEGAVDTIYLSTDGGVYYLGPQEFFYDLVLMGNPNFTTKPKIVAKHVAGANWMWVRDDFVAKHVDFDGYDTQTATYDSIRYAFKYDKTMAADGGPNETPDLTLFDVNVMNIHRYADPSTAGSSKDGNVLDASRKARWGDILIEQCTFAHTGDEALRAINTHKDTVANNMIFDSFHVKNCTFWDIRGTSIKVESDGDSTTYDGTVLIENCTFSYCQSRVYWERDFIGSIFKNSIIANARRGNDYSWDEANSLASQELNDSKIAYIDTFNCDGNINEFGDTLVLVHPAFVDRPEGTNSHMSGSPMTEHIFAVDPMFADAANGDFTLDASSAVRTMADDGGVLGDRRWDPSWVAIGNDDNNVISGFELRQNYPNPFNPSTTIEFKTNVTGKVSLKIYDVTGKLVETLYNGTKPAGVHHFNWQAGSNVASGTYFYRLRTGNNVAVKKMLLLK